MKETELKLHPCYCGGEMKIEKVAQNGGMDGTYYDWVLICNKCGLIKTYAADGFYGRRYKTFEEVVDDWNKEREESSERSDKKSIPYLMHKEMDIPLLECQKAYDIAIEYLRSQGKVRG